MVENIGIRDRIVVSDLDTLRLLADPLRLRLIAIFSEAPSSVKEAAKRVGVPAGKLYYHVELLERHGLIEVAASRVVSGIIEKRYRAVAQEIHVDRKLLALQAPDAALDAMLGAVIDATRAEAERSVRDGACTIGDDDVLMTRVSVRTTPEGARRLRAQIDELIARAHEEMVPDGAEPFNLTIAYFPLSESV